MMTGSELKEWAATISDDSGVAVDDGGLSIVELEDDGDGGFNKTGAYLELGGIPIPEEDRGE